jgi:hypothetical protein
VTTTATRPADACDSLAFARIALGLLLLLSLVRFVARGWVREFYIAPRYFFTYYGFEWVRPLPGWAMYAVFGGLLLAAALVALGAWYRISIAALFVGFTYVELIDKTNYLNHYYFISLLLLLLCWLPLNATCSVDAARQPGRAGRFGPSPELALKLLRLQVGLVYFFAGVAKLKASWLLEAQPLRLWLAAHGNWPIVGPLLEQAWVAYAGSWFGMLFDLTVPFWLLWRRSRPWAYAVVVVFHVLTWLLFYIGMFPWIMMVAALVFFEPEAHRRILKKGGELWKWMMEKVPGVRYWVLSVRGKEVKSLIRNTAYPTPDTQYSILKPQSPLQTAFLCLFFGFQFLFPFRYLIYTGDPLWTEQGYRFSWNVMLMEKSGFVEYTVRETGTGREFTVVPGDYLSKQQVRMLSTQPDMILQFAHFLAQEYRRRGLRQPQVFAECYVALNGRSSRLLINPRVDLARQQEGWGPKAWILPAPK